jgi:hypothetical protein
MVYRKYVLTISDGQWHAWAGGLLVVSGSKAHVFNVIDAAYRKIKSWIIRRFWDEKVREVAALALTEGKNATKELY